MAYRVYHGISIFLVKFRQLKFGSLIHVCIIHRRANSHTHALPGARPLKRIWSRCICKLSGSGQNAKVYLLTHKLPLPVTLFISPGQVTIVCRWCITFQTSVKQIKIRMFDITSDVTTRFQVASSATLSVVVRNKAWSQGIHWWRHNCVT